MSKHTIEISDEDNKSFKIILSIGYSGNSIGSWRSLDKGFIKFNGGRVRYLTSEGTQTTNHVMLFEDPQSEFSGLRLNDYSDWLGVNDQGMGYLWQTWAIGLKPSRISWILVD